MVIICVAYLGNQSEPVQGQNLSYEVYVYAGSQVFLRHKPVDCLWVLCYFMLAPL